MTHFSRIGSLLFCAFLCTDCAFRKIDPATSDVTIDAPAAWKAASKGAHGAISTGWLSEFRDPKLTLLVHQALRDNPGLKATANRLEGARESLIIGKSNRLPSLSAGTSTSRRYDGLGPGPGISSESYALTLNASWEIDLWGKLRDRDYAIRADYESTLAIFRGARLSLAANTARAWINLVTAQQQLELAGTTLASFKANLNIIERRYRANLLRAVDVQFGRNNVAAAHRNLSSRTLERNEAARSMELLLGRYPSAELKARSSLPTLSSKVPAGLPSELIARRPDLVAAGADLSASAYRAVAARKDLLPSLRLTGSGGNADSDFKRAIDPAYLAWAAAASLSQTIYDGGAPSAQARAALARNKAEIDDYVRIALNAFREVESALESESSFAEQEGFLLQEVEQSGLAESQSERDLALGIDGSTVLEILEAQRRAVNSRSSLIQLRNRRLQNRLDLHLALGGDFETQPKSSN